MTDTQFQEQGGMATMDPSPLLRWVSSKFMTYMADQERVRRRRQRLEKQRQRRGEPHRIEYFHQLEDAYSHLAVQLLAPLLERYDVELVCHQVHAAAGRNAPEPELLLELARVDAAAVAADYGLEFPSAAQVPDAALIQRARRLLAGASQENFAQTAIAVGAALFAGNEARLTELATQLGSADAETTSRLLDLGTSRRAQLKHYSGAMFYYQGEWYWGVDRFYHLEARLRELGARRTGCAPIAPRPGIEDGPLKDNGSLTLEFYPSLRSPYTSIIFDTTLALAQSTGVNLVVRPVLPMVMRGVPATREKGQYIIFDTAREAAALGLRWGTRICDPIGDPVRRAYALYPWVVEQGQGNRFLSEFLKAAFTDGINTNTSRGMRQVVEATGLSWSQASQHLNDSDWEALIEANRLAMYGFGCWGVPSYRLLDSNGDCRLALWGQDRLWLISREIQRCLAGESLATAAD